MVALLLLAGLVAGTVGTIALLRMNARRVRMRLRSQLRSKEIVWGAQVRWRKRIRGWGASGVMVLNSANELQWLPSDSSLKRGSSPRSWTDARVRLIAERRDITGLLMREYQLFDSDGSSEGRFAATAGVGQLPASTYRAW